jgi:glycosyltransferase involved in cell wall biosynthesis
VNIVIATDAWPPQMNGVVRTLTTTVDVLNQRGHNVRIIDPSLFASWPFPFYPEIRLAWSPTRLVGPMIEAHRPCAIHIATEGPVGQSARRWCLRNRHAFTTSYHTNFPEYLSNYLWLPEWFTYGLLRKFHRPARRVMVSTPTMQKLLRDQKFPNELAIWSRGVNTELFHPRPEVTKGCDGRPVALYVGRVAFEKNIDAFLECPIDCKKRVVGRGPELDRLRQQYPDVDFTGPLTGEALAEAFCSADVFVFPSRTDTFGLVMLEALACGLPVAAFPVPGPLDVIGDNTEVGCLNENLADAVRTALANRNPEACRNFALQFTWEKSTDQFFNNLAFEEYTVAEPQSASPGL